MLTINLRENRHLMFLDLKLTMKLLYTWHKIRSMKSVEFFGSCTTFKGLFYETRIVFSTQKNYQ